jgi:hypothetical protein
VMMLTPAARRWLEENESRRILKLYGYLLASEARAAQLTGP